MSNYSPLLFVLLNPSHTCGRVAGDLLAVQCLPEDYLHDTEYFVDGCWGVFYKQPRSQVEDVGTCNL